MIGAHASKYRVKTRAHHCVCVCVCECASCMCELCKNILKLRRRWLQPPFAIVVCLVLCSWPAWLLPCPVLSPHMFHIYLPFIYAHCPLTPNPPSAFSPATHFAALVALPQHLGKLLSFSFCLPLRLLLWFVLDSILFIVYGRRRCLWRSYQI